MIYLQHLLALLLVVAVPLWDRYEIPRLKASTLPGKKIRYYIKMVVASWICALIAMAAAGITSISHIVILPGEITWLEAGTRGRLILEGLTAGMLAAMFLPALLAARSKNLRKKPGKAARQLAFLLPSNREERKWWWAVCITAGVCEEIVYRGFLMHYLHANPWHVSLIWALLISSFIFGIGHLYQGVAGAASTVAVGFLFGGFYVITGSLLLPVLIHTLMDLRALLMLPEGFDEAETSVS